MNSRTFSTQIEPAVHIVDDRPQSLEADDLVRTTLYIISPVLANRAQLTDGRSSTARKQPVRRISP